ncbi:SDR family oxidoreductase [Nocardiopsis potens]|uniref:SDR family oxidoreductase n=1 Tax=Nocardiopsis potens TaxID=1246458 RepID=UPI000345D38F|nr:NAD(P)H-binding protein [Nocardiopsis potens]
MTTTLVTGGTGDLGTPTAAALRTAGHRVRVLSRRTGPGLTTGDLLTGEGVPQALDGADTVVHCATANAGSDITAAANLFAEADRAGVGHLVLISIVGIDRIPLPFYRQRLEIERLLTGSGLPHTIQRATQFHSLIARIFAAQKRLPVLLVPRIPFQPIDVTDVADRLTELASGDPAGRAPDIGGPEVLRAGVLARQWQRATGSRKPILQVSAPGKTFAAFARGENLVPGTRFGGRTFREYSATR